MQAISISQNTAAKALYNIPPFKDNEFEVWLGAVGNAFHGAGILPLLRITTTDLILRPPKIYGKPSKLTRSGSLVWLGRRSQKQSARTLQPTRVPSLSRLVM